MLARRLKARVCSLRVSGHAGERLTVAGLTPRRTKLPDRHVGYHQIIIAGNSIRFGSSLKQDPQVPDGRAMGNASRMCSASIVQNLSA